MLESPDTEFIPAYQDKPYTPPDYDVLEELTSTKYLGTLRTMASPASYSPVPAAAAPVMPAESAPTTPPKPLNPGLYYRPTSPSHHHHSIASEDGSPKVLAKFFFNTLALVRLMALGFAIGVVVVLFDKDTQKNAPVVFFIILMFAMLLWQIFALLMQGRRQSRKAGERRKKNLVIDLGFVKCIFACQRKQRDDDDEDGGESDVLLGWVPGDASKKISRRNLLYTATDVLFSILMFTIAMVSAKDPMSLFWNTALSAPVCAFASVLIGLQIVIAVAQQFAILKRAKIQVLHDDEEDEDDDDAASPKYRIRLPQSPDRAHPVMSVAA